MRATEFCPNVYHGEDRVQTAIAAKVYWRGVRVSNFRGDRRVAPAARTVVQRRHHPQFRAALQTALHGLLALSVQSQVRTGLRAGGGSHERIRLWKTGLKFPP